MREVQVFVGIDVGGSHIGVCLVNNKCEMMCSHEFDISRDIVPEDAVRQICLSISALITETRAANSNANVVVSAIGLGIPGIN